MQYSLSGNASKMVIEIKRNTKGLNIAKIINETIVNNIYKQYHVYFKFYGRPEIISRKGVAVKWSNKTYLFASKIADILKYDKLLILNFYLALYDLAKAGKIEYKHFDPLTAVRGDKAIAKINPTGLKVLSDYTNKPLRNITIVAVSIGVIYLVYKFKKD